MILQHSAMRSNKAMHLLIQSKHVLGYFVNHNHPYKDGVTHDQERISSLTENLFLFLNFTFKKLFMFLILFPLKIDYPCINPFLIYILLK